MINAKAFGKNLARLVDALPAIKVCHAIARQNTLLNGQPEPCWEGFGRRLEAVRKELAAAMVALPSEGLTAMFEHGEISEKH